MVNIGLMASSLTFDHGTSKRHFAARALPRSEAKCLEAASAGNRPAVFPGNSGKNGSENMAKTGKAFHLWPPYDQEIMK